jgi:hypothetical protein
LLQELSDFHAPQRRHLALHTSLNGVLTSKPHRTFLAAETVLPSSDHFDHGDSLWDEYVTHWVFEHLVLFFILGLRR